MQYKLPFKAATPQLLLLEDMEGTAYHFPSLGSNLINEFEIKYLIPVHFVKNIEEGTKKS